MSQDDYLWDGSGDPDPDVARLEEKLAVLQDPAARPPALDARPKPARRPRRGMWLAAAAIVAIAVTGIWRAPGSAQAGFSVTALAGTPRVGDRPLSGSGLLELGAWLVTDSTSRARIQIANIGQVSVQPGTRVRLARSDTEQHRLTLQAGSISVEVTAPPRLFVVDTPAATAVDLGCAYTLEVDQDGSAMLEVTSGRVAWENPSGPPSVLAAGFRCRTRKGQAPCIPYSAASAVSVADLETLGRGDAASEHALARVVAASQRPADALTLWHLLERVDPTQREIVYERLAELVALPRAQRSAVLALEPTYLEIALLQVLAATESASPPPG